MKRINNTHPSYILEDGVYKLNGDFKDPVRNDERQKVVDNSIQIILPIESILDDNYKFDSEGVLEYIENAFVGIVIQKEFKKKVMLGLLFI